MTRLHTLLVLLFFITRGALSLSGQSDLWNASFHLTPAQIKAAGISKATAQDVEVALRYERTNNAGSLIQDDPFYDLPSSYDASNPPAPGTVLKVEQFTNITLYTMPMSLSMSRFLYMTETYNGTSMPASAYVLWPYLPRKFPNLTPCSKSQKNARGPVFPVIGLAHGSSGQTTACAPSGLRALWDDFHEPFPMALSGYAVVAPDYLGLGVRNTTSPYFVLPSQANDLFYAIEAAQKIWPESLSKEFVIAGQSQGGGVAWASAQRQAQKPVEGYLGTMAASAFTNTLGSIAADAEAEDNSRVVGIAQGLDTVLRGFEMSEWITEIGIRRWKLVEEIQGCGVSQGALFADGVKILKDGWNLTDSAKWYQSINLNGGKPFAGPMLVIQGTEDPNANEPVTTEWVHKTCNAYPESQLEYIRWQNITHVPVLYAGQHLWLDWIRDRFAGVEASKGCSQQTLSPARGYASADFEGFLAQTWFVEYDEYGI